MNKTAKLIGSFGVLALIVFLVLSFPWGLIYLGGAGGGGGADVEGPEITYGEFPFKLVYEINGEEITVEDTMICKFNGYSWNEAVGRHRTWKEWLESDPNEATVLLTSDDKREIYCFVGDAEYYMNDEGIFPEKKPLTPRIYDVRLDDDLTVFTQKQLLEMYNIKLISWEFSDPIVNSFK